MKGVPIENQIEPDEQLVWNVAQALKACISKEELREIFASLLASASDSRKAKLVHPLFPFVIQQMSPRDAANFKHLYTKKKIQVPIMDLRPTLFGVTGQVQTSIFIANPEFSGK